MLEEEAQGDLGGPLASKSTPGPSTLVITSRFRAQIRSGDRPERSPPARWSSRSIYRADGRYQRLPANAVGQARPGLAGRRRRPRTLSTRGATSLDELGQLLPSLRTAVAEGAAGRPGSRSWIASLRPALGGNVRLGYRIRRSATAGGVNQRRSSSVVEQGTHKPLVASSTLASATNPSFRTCPRSPGSSSDRLDESSPERGHPPRPATRRGAAAHRGQPCNAAPRPSAGASYPY
jgi:hypothetical protein